MTLLSERLNPNEIADLLNISVPTVETHIQRIKTKLNLDSGQKLYYFAFEYNSKRGDWSYLSTNLLYLFYVYDESLW